MATLSKDEILGAISEMTVLEVSELVKAFEEKFGVSAAAPIAVAAAPASGAEAGEAAEEQTEFTISLTGIDDGKKIPIIKELRADQKVQVIKAVRAITGLGLKEAKGLVENMDKPIKEDVSKEEAEKLKEQLETAGAKVEIK